MFTFLGEPPEKFVKYLARHEYKIGIDFQEGVEKDAYRYRYHSCSSCFDFGQILVFEPDPVPVFRKSFWSDY